MNMPVQISKSCVLEEGRPGCVEGDHSGVFGNIFQANTNITIWHRALSNQLLMSAENILDKWPLIKLSELVTPVGTNKTIENIFGSEQGWKILGNDIMQLVDIFCHIFGLKHARLRLTTLDHAMCPRFHVDRIPCRLITTYQGVATEWLPNMLADRSKLGPGNQGQSDERSGLFDSVAGIQKLNRGDVALLKGETWEKNLGSGLIHRSPQLPRDSKRLLLTLDFVGD
jgi:hypothetical protein